MTNHPIARWHSLVESRDPAGLKDLLAEDAVFFSPVVHTAQRGKAVTTVYLSAAFKVFFTPSFRYVREIAGTNDAMLEFEFEVEVNGITVNGVDIIKWNEAGQITEFKVMLRPLMAINVIHEQMGAMLASMKRGN